jgi:hypothetical protein
VRVHRLPSTVTSEGSRDEERNHLHLASFPAGIAVSAQAERPEHATVVERVK